MKERKNIFFICLDILIICLLVFLDQITKFGAINFLKDKDDFTIIKGVLSLHYLENTGAAFSLLEGKQLLFSIVTPVFGIVLLYIMIKMPKSKKFLPLNYIIVFLIAGAVGNYIDRIMNHYVVDFIYFSLINFPVFNVADCYVTVSVIILFILILFFYKDEDLDYLKQCLRIKNNG